MKGKKNNEDGKIGNIFFEITAYEITVEWNGWSFIVIYGKHINGWFVAIPNRNVCAEIADPRDIYYNADKISEAFVDADKGIAVAKALKRHWEGTQK